MLEKTRAVTAPLAAERTKLPAQRRMGHQAGTGGLSQRRCCRSAVKFLGLCSETLLADPSVRRRGTLSAFVCSLGCWSGSAGLCEQEHRTAGGMRSSLLPLWAEKKTGHSTIVFSWLLSGDDRGGLGPKQAEQAALGRHLCSTDLVFGRCWSTWDRGRADATWYFALHVAQVCSGRGLSAGAKPCWPERRCWG